SNSGMPHSGMPHHRDAPGSHPSKPLRLVLAGAIVAVLSAAVVSAASADEPHQGGTIRYGHEQEPPCLYAGWIQAGYIQRQYADNLVAKTHDGRIVPWIATEWTISD